MAGGRGSTCWGPVVIVAVTAAVAGCEPQTQSETAQAPATESSINGGGEQAVAEHVFPIQKTDEEWRALLTEEQYRVLRTGGTECAFGGEFWNQHEDGVYHCAGCDSPLFDAQTKFESGTGWPSFYEAVEKGAVIERTDRSHGMVRTEVLCSQCGGHLGHVFKDGPAPTGLRYCINSAALIFRPREAGGKESAEQ